MLYGVDGRPVEIHVNGNIVLQDITYHPFGAPKSWIWGNGQPHHRSFDLDGRLTQHPLGPDIQTITFDAASHIIGTNQTNPIYNRIYEYDSLDRLIRQTDNTSTRQWDYDANSNRIYEQSGSTIYPYTLDPASNRLLTVAGPVAKTYTYDAAGNPLTDGITDYTWNTAGRLTKSVAGNRVSVHLYNGLGERTLKIGSRSTRGGPYLYFYDSAGKLIGDYEKTKGAKQTTNWMQKQETIWLGDIPIAVIKQPIATEPAQIYFIHTDHLNTPRLIVDQTNTPVWRWDNQNAFGNNPPDEDPDGNRKLFEYNLRFAGQYFDTETNLHYNYFRDYESATGRYLTPDPIGLMGGLNVWGYALQNPSRWTDPFGLDIIITLYKGQNGNIFNHIGIGSTIGNNANRTFGAGPDSGVGLFFSIQGHVRLDRGKPIATLTIPSTTNQDALINIFNDDAANNSNFQYSLLTNSCVDHVRNALHFSGIDFFHSGSNSRIGYIQTIRGLTTNLPNVLFNSLIPLGTVIYH